MFGLAISYKTLAPMVQLSKYGESIWFTFFHAVVHGQKATVSLIGEHGFVTHRVEWDGDNFSFFVSGA
jgi:hypothetical protein